MNIRGGRFFRVIITLFLIGPVIGCAGVPGNPAPATAQLSPTVVDLQATSKAATKSANQAATQEAEAIALSTINAAETLNAQATTTAVFKATERIQNIRATSTQVEVVRQSHKATEDAGNLRAATAQARPLYDFLQQMQGEGVIPPVSGDFTPLWEFDESWAQINWYRFWYFGYSLKNFALRANAYWSSASEKANYFNSGCGIIFNYQDEDNYHVIFLTMDGYAEIVRQYHGNSKILKRNYYGPLAVPEDEAEFELLVLDSEVFFYVDGQKAIQAYDSTIRQGDIGFTVSSGTNKGYGTRCRMSDAGFWELE